MVCFERMACFAQLYNEVLNNFYDLSFNFPVYTVIHQKKPPLPRPLIWFKRGLISIPCCFQLTFAGRRDTGFVNYLHFFSPKRSLKEKLRFSRNKVKIWIKAIFSDLKKSLILISVGGGGLIPMYHCTKILQRIQLYELYRSFFLETVYYYHYYFQWKNIEANFSF